MAVQPVCQPEGSGVRLPHDQPNERERYHHNVGPIGGNTQVGVGAIRVDERDMDIMARALLIAQHTIERKNQRLAQATAQITVLEPKARTLDMLTSVEGTYSVSDAAKLLSNDTGYTIGRDRLFTFMAQLGWIYRDAGTRGPACYTGEEPA